MKKYKEYLITAFYLVSISIIMYFFHYKIFGDFKNTMYYTFLDIAFIPVNVLIVTLVFQNILERKEKQRIMEKLNMLIGLFFNEIGCSIMIILVKGDIRAKNLISSFDDLKQVEKNILCHEHNIDISRIDIDSLYKILSTNKNIIISLIGNQNILEHETFSELLMSVTHLLDEISFRKSHGMDEDDLKHIEKDVIRVYKLITFEWVVYLKYLKGEYPYLYSSAIKLNPFEL